MRPFELIELESMICGELNQSDWTRDKLKTYFTPAHGYTESHENYQNFIDYLVNLEPAKRPSFVGWMTGIRRLPMGGFKALEPQPTVNKKSGGGDDTVPFPSVMTCTNYIRLPNYSSYAVLKEKFDEAIQVRAFHQS